MTHNKKKYKVQIERREEKYQGKKGRKSERALKRIRASVKNITQREFVYTWCAVAFRDGSLRAQNFRISCFTCARC